MHIPSGELSIAYILIQFARKITFYRFSTPCITCPLCSGRIAGVNESRNEINELTIKYNTAEKAVKQYEMLKKEYDKQVAWDLKIRDIKEAVLSSIVVGVLFFGFMLFWWYIYCQHKKYRRQLEEGKLTQVEYDR